MRSALVVLALLTALVRPPASHGAAESGGAASGVAFEAATRRGLEATEAGRYGRALAAFDEVVAAAPGRAEGYFFRAAVFQILAGHFDRPAYQKGFDENAARALSRAEARVKAAPGEAEAHLLAGLTQGMIAVRAIQRRHYLTAFRRGRETARSLERAIALRPGLEDAYYGLGVYYYWRSRARWARLITRLKIVEDTGDKGLRYLRRAAARGRWLKTLARIELVWALYGEERFAEGRKALAPLLRRHPDQPL